MKFVLIVLIAVALGAGVVIDRTFFTSAQAVPDSDTGLQSLELHDLLGVHMWRGRSLFPPDAKKGIVSLEIMGKSGVTPLLEIDFKREAELERQELRITIAAWQMNAFEKESKDVVYHLRGNDGTRTLSRRLVVTDPFDGLSTAQVSIGGDDMADGQMVLVVAGKHGAKTNPISENEKNLIVRVRYSRE